MGRGLSAQQRDILTMAKAFNAANHGGTPAVVELADYVPAGAVYPRQHLRMAVVDLGWAPTLPDYHDGYGFWLSGFRSEWGEYGKRWKPSTVSKSRRVSLTRAVDSLLKRGLLMEAMYPGFVVSHCRVDGRLAGYGSQANAADPWAAIDAYEEESRGPLRTFWYHQSDSLPAYWLTQAGHDAANDAWQDMEPSAILDAYHKGREPWRSGAGRHRAWWDHSTPEARQNHANELARIAASLAERKARTEAIADRLCEMAGVAASTSPA